MRPASSRRGAISAPRHGRVAWCGALLGLWWTLLVGCASTAVDPPAHAPPRDPERPAPQPAPVPPAPTVIEPADAVLSLGDYRHAFEGVLTEGLRLLPPILEAPTARPFGHAVITLGEPSQEPRYRTITVGFGRRPQPHRFGSTPPFVELLAESGRPGARLREALSQLGRFLHDPDRPISVRFRAFDTLRLDEPIFGERYFVLVPGGEVVLDEDLAVTVLRVIPMAEDDFIQMNMRGDGAIRVWWAKHRGSVELLRRWDAVLGVPPSG